MSHVVVISGHPDLSQSYTNTVILEQLEARLDSVEIRRLDTLYPDYKIDVEAEQAALLKADIIILQYPFYWYTMPGLLKKWMDDVMTFNFAYGPEGDKLKGKELIISFTVGGPQDSYDPLDDNHFPIEHFMYPLQQTAYLSGLKYNKPVYTHQMVYTLGIYNKLEDVQARAISHSDRLISLINDLNVGSPEKSITRFVNEWFAAMDKLTTEDSFFTKSLADDINWSMPHASFVGHAGFSEWYAEAQQTIKPDCSHDVQQVDITAHGDNSYTVEMRVQLNAETYEESALKGEVLDKQLKELWTLDLDKSGKITIHEYLVSVL